MHVSIEGMKTSVLVKKEKKLILTDSLTYSMWFERFIRGLHNMMGDDIKPDRAVDIKLLHHMLDTLQECLDSATPLEGKKRIDDMGSALFFSWVDRK